MAEKIGTVIVVAPTESADCELCGQSAELRPYGPDGKSICVDCAEMDPEGTQTRMMAVLTKMCDGSTHVVGPQGQILRVGHLIEDLEPSGEGWMRKS